MAYQTVRTPRFWVCNLQFLQFNGFLEQLTAENLVSSQSIENLIGINPHNTSTLTWENVEQTTLGNIQFNFNINSFADTMPSDNNFCMFLGHNFGSTATNAQVVDNVSKTNYVNNSATGQSPVDGYSIMVGDNADDLSTNTIKFDLSSETGQDIKIGSLLYGTYHDLPQSPDLSLTQTISYEKGYKITETKGGSELVNKTWSSTPAWGDNAAWELGSGTGYNKISRSGRKVWDLSFSYIANQKLFGSNQSLVDGSDLITTFGALSNVDSEDLSADSSSFTTNILTDDNFYSQVIHKLGGGALPFVFQPDNNYPEFFIARLDMDSFKFTQTAHNVHNISLKIRESW